MRQLFPLALLLGACATPRDPVNDLFPEAQAELRAAVESIRRDAMNGNTEGLKGAHLNSRKFTKFGPRSFGRQNLWSANESEAAFFGSVRNLDYRIEDLKIDVFGDIGIATYYPHVSFSLEGEAREASGRQTLVFLKTAIGWKLVHEHGTPRRDDDP
jgi:ketosteroid isomerase-like protein